MRDCAGNASANRSEMLPWPCNRFHTTPAIVPMFIFSLSIFSPFFNKTTTMKNHAKITFFSHPANSTAFLPTATMRIPQRAPEQFKRVHCISAIYKPHIQSPLRTRTAWAANALRAYSVHAPHPRRNSAPSATGAKAGLTTRQRHLPSAGTPRENAVSACQRKKV